jgi:DNA-binding NarL/FixJ family response regulator
MPRRAGQGSHVTPLRVLLVDGHQVVADALSVWLSGEPDIIIVATAASIRSAESAAHAFRPDVAIVDIDCRDENGLELVAWLQLRHPDCKVVVLSGEANARTAADAIRVGASAFVTKFSRADELVQAVRGVSRGESWIDRRLLTDVLRYLRVRAQGMTEPEARVASLTRREREVLECLIVGLDRRGIAERLYLSPNTVRTHVKHILKKLDVHSSLAAVSLALRAGVVAAPVTEPTPGKGIGTAAMPSQCANVRSA